jgi:predicted dehydrogenase
MENIKLILMKKIIGLLSIFVSVFLLTNCTTQNYDGYKIINGKIICDVPLRSADQTSMLAYAAPKLETVRVGFVGLGMRGPGAVYRFTYIPGVEIVALCDYEADRASKAQEILKEKGLPEAALYSGEDGWRALCERDDIDLVYICTDWVHHVPIAKYAMECGKHTAIEVPAAMNMKDIWSLIQTSEKTKKHCMQLENCVYDFFELTTLNMAQQGVFGEVLHVEGSYIHNLSEFWGAYWHDWRMEYNREHRGDVYPTHGLGPACQLLGIHRQDMMKTLVSMDTKSTREEGFKNGDHTMTMISTVKGKTIQIQHDVTSPRPYSRMYQLTGTKGFANKYPVQGYALEAEQVSSDITPDHENLSAHSFVSDDVMKALMEKYKHPFIKELESIAKKVGGHGGMDFIMDYRLIYCLHNGLPLDMDVYDLAEWCSLTELSALSIENGNIPVEIPDFTRGAAKIQ